MHLFKLNFIIKISITSCIRVRTSKNACSTKRLSQSNFNPEKKTITNNLRKKKS